MIVVVTGGRLHGQSGCRLGEELRSMTSAYPKKDHFGAFTQICTGNVLKKKKHPKEPFKKKGKISHLLHLASHN